MSKAPLNAELGPMLSHHVSLAGEALYPRLTELLLSASVSGARSSSRVTLVAFQVAVSTFEEHLKQLYEDTLHISTGYLGDSTPQRVEEIVILFNDIAEILGGHILRVVEGRIPLHSHELQDSSVNSFRERVVDTIDRYKRRLPIEVQIKMKERNKMSSLNFNGNVGTAVIGDHNNVQTTQTFSMSAEDVGKIVLAIRDIREAIKSQSNVSDAELATKLKTLDELQEQAISQQPSRGAFGQALEHVSNTVQSLASAPEAYATALAALEIIRSL